MNSVSLVMSPLKCENDIGLSITFFFHHSVSEKELGTCF